MYGVREIVFFNCEFESSSEREEKEKERWKFK